MTQLTRDNHFVPQAYLRRWSDDGKRVYCYRTVVAHKRVPEWEPKSIRGVAYQRDLYTGFANGQEVDDFERWIKSDFEDPAMEALEKVASNAPLGQGDWERLAMFAAAQDMRTPASFNESMERWQKELPETLERSVRQSVRRIEEAQSQGLPLAPGESNSLSSFFKVHINREDKPTIQVEVTTGRGFWLDSIRHVLTGSAKIARQHKWSIAEPAGKAEWLTSDHPMLRLNYYERGNYDFRGGWGKHGTELILPLSPRHLLYTKVGDGPPDRFTFSPEHTSEVQRLLVERAHRCIVARRPTKIVGRFRPRQVDPVRLKAEESVWKHWHEEQRKAEEHNAIAGRNQKSQEQRDR